MSNIYLNGEYLERNPTWHIDDSPWKAKQIIKIMEANRIEVSSICEVGCGAGEILNQPYHQLPEDIVFHGYEISRQAFEVCQKRKKGRIHFHLMDLLEDQGAFFDCILCIDVVEHVEDYFGFLRKLQKKGEYKIFHIPLDLSVQRILRSTPILRERQRIGHIQLFTKETALGTLRETGYKVIDYFYTASSIELPDRGVKASLLKLPRRLAYYLNKDLTVRILGGFSLMVLAK